ncbi:MAG: hypothetical protein E6H00_12840 [Bacillati bacterium ANGP1]|uniref:Lipoprotein n=1 Tax=Candidatus Segetimicrobium genomatis TaxID=2569760 RepID=A0A537JXP5_9BACT|nr:MAG: hypothetical protein E6H00_12840 [Terrabacteria group bacterium ANGP1]
MIVARAMLSVVVLSSGCGAVRSARNLAHCAWNDRPIRAGKPCPAQFRKQERGPAPLNPPTEYPR